MIGFSSRYRIFSISKVIKINLFDKKFLYLIVPRLYTYSLYTVVFRSCCRAYIIQLWSVKLQKEIKRN